MSPRRKPPARYGDHRTAMTLLREAQGHVHGRETTADQQQRFGGVDVAEGIRSPRIRDEKSTVVQPAIRAAGGTRRQITHRQHDDVSRELASVGQQYAATVLA